MQPVCPAPATAREPGFLRALDQVQMTALVREHLGDGSTIVQLQPDYVRWKERDGSLVGWRARIGADGTPSYVTARSAPLDRLADEAARLQHRDEEEHDGLRAFALVPDAELLLVAFPLDRQLPDLRRLVRASKLRSLLLDHRPDLVPEGMRFSKSRSACELVRYKPERRAVLRWDLGFVDPTERAESRTTIWVRLLAEPLPARAALARAAANCGVRVPSQLAAPHDRLMLESHLSGQPWTYGDHAPMAVTAAALARLHGAALPFGAPVHGPIAELDLVLRAVDDLGRLHSERGQSAGALADALTSAVPAASRPCLLHGDFHCGQVLLHGDAGLCDLDRACAGPAAADLAAFHAHCLTTDPRAGDAFAAAFRAAYGLQAPLPSTRELAWWNACALLRAAISPFRALRSDWPAASERLLQWAGKSVAEATQ